MTTEQIYEKVKDAVVVIRAYNANNELIKQGSGVVINNKGYVVTNYHVLEGGNKIEVLHKKKLVHYNDIIGIDAEKDIIILKIDEKNFPYIKIFDSGNISIGQRVYAIGNPLGFENSISEGIISGLRNNETTGINFIQITASISSGSSGGAVVNDNGELIGISALTAIEGQNVNFAIPIEDILAVKIDSYSKDGVFKVKDKLEKQSENLQDYTKIIEINPNDANAYVNRGKVKAKLENYQGAIRDYTKAIYINPNLADAYDNRAVAKAKLEDYQGAIQDYTKVIEINPNDGVAYMMCGVAKINLEDHQGAIQDYTKAIEINPNLVAVYQLRGLAKDKLKDYQGAIQDYTKVIQIYPNDAIVHNLCGIAKTKLEEYQGSIHYYNKAIEINPNYSDAHKNRGFSKYNLEDYRGAIQDYNKAIEINPNYIVAYRNRGFAKYNLGDKYGACLDWSKAGELGDNTAYDLIKKYCK